jgi:hypothetical protein
MVREKHCRSPRLQSNSSKYEAGGDPKRVRLAARQHGYTGYQACYVGCIDGLGVSYTPCAIPQACNTSAISRRAPRGCSSTMLDHLDREVEPSLSGLPWPHQASVVPLYSVATVTSRVKSATIQMNSSGNRLPRAPAGRYSSRGGAVVLHRVALGSAGWRVGDAPGVRR